jgi:Domain of unknown function (DUF4386)
LKQPPQAYNRVAGMAVEEMNPNRRTAVLVGALFLISTATFIFSNVLISPLLASHNFLAAVAGHSQLMIAASLIALIEGTATVGIALVLYPILKGSTRRWLSATRASGSPNSPLLQSALVSAASCW